MPPAELEALLGDLGVPEPEPLRPDPFQLEALEQIATRDVIVDAPTGAGKTWIAVEAIRAVLERGGRAFYTAPLKALSNSKHLELGRTFGEDRVGIATGDRQENLTAPVLVCTTEIYRNRLYDVLRGEAEVTWDLVVFDEAHYLADPDRGVVWEESLIFSPPEVRCLLLSATADNADDLAAWMSETRGAETVVVDHHERPVPLRLLFVHPRPIELGPFWGRGNDDGRKLHPTVRRVVDGWRARQKGGRGGRRTAGGMPTRATLRRKDAIPHALVIEVLRQHDLLPALVFMGARAACDEAADSFLHGGVPWLPDERQGRIRAVLDRLAESQPILASHRHRETAIKTGVAAHHAGHHPGWKLALETLMNEGLLDAVFCTSTMAAGVDFPTRTVCLSRSVTWDGKEERPFLGREIQQMTGRAGRRGKDRVGFAAVVPTPAMDVDELARSLRARAEPLESQFKPGYTMALNLLVPFDPEGVRALLDRSFAQWQRAEWIDDYRAKAAKVRRRSAERARKKGRPEEGGAPPAADRHDRAGQLEREADRLEGSLWREFGRYASVLRRYGYLDEGERPTEEGRWAALLRLDHPVLVGEAIRQGTISPGAPLVAMAASLAGGDREVRANAKLPGELLRPLIDLENLARGIGAAERAVGIHAPVTINVGAAWAIDRIITGQGWPEIDCEEGDLVRLAWRTVDVLRQLGNLAETHPDLARAARGEMRRLQDTPELILD